MYYTNTIVNENQVEIGQRVRKTLKRAAEGKRMNEQTVSYLRKLGLDERANRMADCGRFIEFTLDRVSAANFCRDRLCAVCAWRRHLKTTAQARDVIMQIHTDGYVFITLTIKSIAGADLSDSITDMLKSWERLTKTVRWQKAYQGYMRGLEVT